ncbi:hypothetical protein [uncultured Eubacterium sp.]|uniref:hypothetical protein n=1 Tax=uncultured Eubacterium sp. TaxID=165185 RepID=UPI0025F217FE|nr:hypothetical protein [uncultured Eubacterium sp.]
MGKWRKLLALVGIGCLILTGCGQNGDVTADSSSSQAEAKNHNYQTEEEVFQAMKTGDNDSVQALGNFYTSEFYLDYGTHVRLMDTEGNVHEPAYEMIENEEGESVSEIPAGQNFYYRPIFKFSAENQVFGDNLTSVVVNAGLQYEVDDNGAVVNDRAMLSYFRFPHELSDGSYTSGDGKDAADIAQLLGTDNFSEQFFDWIQDVRDHAETMKTFSNDADYFNTILQYRAEYMNYYTIKQWRDGHYDCFIWPSGDRQIEVRKRDDGKYEVSEQRTYYMDVDFLESTSEYDEDILRDQAKKLKVIGQSTVASSVATAVTMDVSDLEPVLDETVYYLVDDMPQELQENIDTLKKAMYSK